MLATALTVLLQASPVPTFSAQVQVVGVTVTATDAKTGRPISGMSAHDFLVLEDGRMQPVVHFEQHEVPASVLVLLDTSMSMRRLIPAIRDAAARLIRTLRSGDEVQVASFDVRVRTLCDFTTDHDAAVASLSSLVPGEETSLHMALYVASRQLEDRHRGDVERRRVLILLSDGEDSRATLASGAALDELRKSGIVCYVVHLQQSNAGDFSGASRVDQARRFMESLVYETGGRLAPVPFPHEPYILRSVFTDIGDELGMQYHIAYTRNAEDDRSGWHAISVTLRSRSDIRLRFRRSYYVSSRR